MVDANPAFRSLQMQENAIGQVGKSSRNRMKMEINSLDMLIVVLMSVSRLAAPTPPDFHSQAAL